MLIRRVSSPTHLLVLGALSIGLCGCNSDGQVGEGGSGGRSGSGGITGSGGRAGSGGSQGSGGATGSGGKTGSGGAIGSGGKTGSGGAPGSGGRPGSGGAPGSGGRPGSGGAPGSGGSNNADATIVPDPSWACGRSDGIPPPTHGELVFRATVQLGATHDVGVTQYGHRRILDVKSGTITGDRVQASVLSGGLELELTLSNGSVELEQIYMLRTSSGAYIYLRSCGVAPAGDEVVRIVPDFEIATSNTLAWLNTGTFAGTRVVNAAAGTLELAVYDVSNVATAAPQVKLEDPAGVANQPWECSTATGGKGSAVFTESVKLGSSLSVGASKRGTRNVIPITGGTITGGLTGSVLSGGADYQLIGTSAKLDARYTLSTSDGEFIVVRNCGPMGALVPLFEARANGPYSSLNANKFVSSDPGMGSGSVTITFYERQ